MPFFESKGFRLHFDETPNTAPEDVIFLHGNLGSNVWWNPMEKVWLKEAEGKKSLLFMEWRGSGQSQGPREESDLRMEKLADDVIALAELRGGNVNLVGHSTGGLIAALAMAKRPELFRKAVFLDPVGAKGIQFGPEMYDAFKAMQINKELCATVILSTIQGGIHDAELKDKIINSAYGIDALNWAGVLNALKDVNYEKEIQKIPHSVLVLHGEQDVLLPKIDSMRMAELLPQGKFHEIPLRGHCTNVEDPALFTQITRTFLFG